MVGLRVGVLSFGALLSCACRLADILKNLGTFTLAMAKILNYLRLLVFLEGLRAVCPALYSLNNNCLWLSHWLLSSTEMLRVKTLHRLLSGSCLLIGWLWAYTGLLKHGLRLDLHLRGRFMIEAEALRHNSRHRFYLLFGIFLLASVLLSLRNHIIQILYIWIVILSVLSILISISNFCGNSMRIFEFELLGLVSFWSRWRT